MTANEYWYLGPPGAGKTTATSRQVSVDAQRYGEANVMALSFTKAAAATLVDRSVPIPERNVGTIHAICYRALGQPALTEDKKPAWNDAYPGYALGGGDTSLDESPMDAPGTTEGEKLYSKYMLFRNKMFPRELWADEVDRFGVAWEDFKAETATLDFTDLIEIAHAEMAACPGAPLALFVDEAQDLVPLQLRLIRKWGEGVERLYLAFDDDQAIYTWLGADPRYLLKADVPPDHKKVLAQSYRVPLLVKRYAETWTARLSLREPKEYRARRHPELDGVDARGEVRRLYDGDFAHPWAILRDAERYLAEGKSVMFLASCSYMIAPMVKALREEAIPFANKYRVTRGDWNPLRTGGRGTTSAQRILAYLKNARGKFWTSQDVAKWADPLMTEGVMHKGAKATLKGWLGSNPFEPTINELTDLFTEEALERLFESELDYYMGHLLTSRRKPLEFPAAIAERRGPELLEQPPAVTVGTIHCSPPDEPILTKRGPVPISELTEDDRLVSYHRPTHSVFGNGDHHNSPGYAFSRSVRPYHGDLITIETEKSRTRVTPNHRVLTSLDEDFFCERWVVYLMRREDWWRVGICTSAHRPYRSGGVAGRLATEQADAGWILSIHESRTEALIAEAIVQGKYGIPGLTFRAAKARSLSDSDLHMIHAATADAVTARAHVALREFGLDSDTPLYIRGLDAEGKSKRNLRGWFVTEAANLVPLSGRIRMATPNGTKKADSHLATTSTHHYDGPVYGLDVPPHRYYVSGGAIVHNSVKGGEADVVYLFPDLSLAGYEEFERDPDPTYRLVYVGTTRARESLILCPGAGERKVEWG